MSEAVTIFNDRIVITVTSTADGAGAFADYTIARVMTDQITSMLGGWWLTLIKTAPGATAPTDDSDLKLEDAGGYDILGGAGTDKISATEKLDFFPQNTQKEPRFWPIVSALTQKISGNSVAGAIVITEYIFTK